MANSDVCGEKTWILLLDSYQLYNLGQLTTPPCLFSFGNFGG